MQVYGNVSVDPQQAAAMRAAGVKVYGNMQVRDAGASPAMQGAAMQAGTPFPAMFAEYRAVPRGAHFIWLGLFIALLTTGLMGIIAATNVGGNDEPPFVGIAIAGCVGAAFCFLRIFTKRFFG